MTKLTLSVSLLLEKKKKKINFLYFRDFLSWMKTEKKTDALSREQRSISQRNFFCLENERARNVEYSETRARLPVNRAIRSISSRSARN